MKRNMISAMALLTASVFVGATVAEAVDVKLGGQLRPRWEYQDRDFNSATDANTQINSRVRLDANVSIDDKTGAFIQLQDNRVFGGTGSAAGSGTTAALNANDSDANVGIHQAYFTLKNVYGTPIDVKFGRQEIVLDGHRLIGNTDWTAGAQSHDGFILSHASGDHVLLWAYSKAIEAGSETNNDETDIDAHVLYGNFKGILGGALSLYFVILDNDALDATSGNTPSDNDFYTIGFRQAGALGGIDYRGEFYYQFGDAAAQGAGFEREAYMFGVRAGKNFGGSLQPTLTLWYDHLSGTDSGDIADKKNKSFDTLFDTGHKFYGYMDRFLNIGTTGRTGNLTTDSVRGLGLRDLAVKGSVAPMENWNLGADLHFFWTAEDMYSSLATNDSNNASKSHLGEELDITLKHKYSASTNFTFGYSHFFAADLVKDTIASSTGKGDDSKWAYIMMDVRF